MPSSTGEAITVGVRLHSILRTRPGGPPRDHVDLSLPPGSTVQDALAALNVPEMEIVFSLNDNLVEECAVLQAGDRLALIPALSGGAEACPVKLT